MDAVISAWKSAIVPPDRLPIWEWARKYVTLPSAYAIPGPFHVEKSLYLKRPLEALQDAEVRTVTCYKAVQTGGSLVSELFVAWLISNYPGPTMWNMQTDEDAKQAAEMRINPLFASCEPIKRLLPIDRFKKKKTEIYFYNMWLLIQGCGLSNIQSKAVQNLINDEVWLWAPGNHSQACKRTTAFSRNCKTLNVSQGGLVDDEMDVAYKKGSMEEWGFRCPKCNELQPYTWKQLKFEQEIYLECKKCLHQIHDTPRERKELNDSGEYIRSNPEANRDNVSVRWNALADSAIRWHTLVEEWKAANRLMKNGSTLQMAEFIQKRLAEPWEDRSEGDEMVIIESDYISNEPWKEEKRRFFTVDVQKECFWAVCRAWSSTGESRLIWEGRLVTIEEVRHQQEILKVTDRAVLIDSSFDTPRVYGYCVQFGWTALNGEPKDSFIHILGNDKKVRKLFSPVQRGDPGIGKSTQGRTYCPLFFFADQSCKDVLQRLKTGHGLSWKIPKDISKEYLWQIDSEAKRMMHNRKTGREEWIWVQLGKRPNHMFDCEKMQIVAAMIDGLLLQEEEVKSNA